MKNVIPGMINISNLQKVALDTNIFICALNLKDLRQRAALSILEEIKIKKLKTSISVLVLEEFFIRIHKQSREKEISSLLDFITIGGLVAILDVNKEIALLAAKLRAEYSSLRTPDTIHLASAISAGANIFITTDRKIPRKIDRLKAIVLEEKAD